MTVVHAVSCADEHEHSVSDGDLAAYAPALRRRFARLGEVLKMWLPTYMPLGSLGKPTRTYVMSTIGTSRKMSWAKFARDILPQAEKIEINLPHARVNLGAMVTAALAGAPPILRWDREEERNPFSWYTYTRGSMPHEWNLHSDEWQTVNAIVPKPSSWDDEPHNHGMGDGVMLVIRGARDLRHQQVGTALFPQLLKPELRSFVEAHSKTKQLEGVSTASVNGLLLSSQMPSHGARLRVTAGPMVIVYVIDRWE